jgi:hypothetical protein
MSDVFSKAKRSGVILSRLRRENEFVAKGGWNGASGFQQRFQMNLGGLLEAQDGLICCSVEPVAQESAHSADLWQRGRRVAAVGYHPSPASANCISRVTAKKPEWSEECLSGE